MTANPKHPMRSMSDEDVERLMVDASAELHRRADLERCWTTLGGAAKRLGISKGSVHHAIDRGALRARRLLPHHGRSSIVLLVHMDDVERYVPRPYPRERLAIRKRAKARKAKAKVRA